MRIYNSKSRMKEELTPQAGNRIGIYVCGPTVYDFFHIGNARPFIIFDVMRSYLEYKEYDIVYVQNFTDIDDRMIKRANENGITVKELADKYIDAYFTDARGLGIKPATIHPRATEHITHMITLIEKLINKGLAYTVKGDVYYRVSAFPMYGSLSGQDMKELEDGASDRLLYEAEKEDPRDFVLWKAHKPNEPYWESPWGKGRPGWHIECSAMSMTYLGETVDIHCGGKDLLFPHHENENAQSSGATGKTYVRYWMHNGFINIDSEKMAKSAGNFITIRDISREYDLEAVRMFMLSAHYRSPINFSREQVMQAQASLSRLYSVKDQLQFLLANADKKDISENETVVRSHIDAYVQRFETAMDDDLNTADALGGIFEMVKEINTSLNHDSSYQLVQHAYTAFMQLCGILGLLQKNTSALPDEVIDYAEQRVKARKEKNWKRSDELREMILGMGYSVEDTAGGQKIRKLT